MRIWLSAVPVVVAALTIPLAPAPRERNQTAPVAAAREAAYRTVNLGVAQLEQFAYDQAAQSFREALQRAPDLDSARVNLAIALFYAGRSADAAAEVGAAATRLTGSPTAHYVSGLIARAEDRTTDAVAAFSRVLEIDPADAATKVQLGQIHLQQRRYAEAGGPGARHWNGGCD